jgi:hypothetical protein
VVDPATRRNLGSQADDFAEQLGAATRLDSGDRTSVNAGPAASVQDAR